jgi:hypothetical protein
MTTPSRVSLVVLSQEPRDSITGDPCDSIHVHERQPLLPWKGMTAPSKVFLGGSDVGPKAIITGGACDSAHVGERQPTIT